MREKRISEQEIADVAERIAKKAYDRINRKMEEEMNHLRARNDATLCDMVNVAIVTYIGLLSNLLVNLRNQVFHQSGEMMDIYQVTDEIMRLVKNSFRIIENSERNEH